MQEYRSVDGELKVLQSDNEFIFPVELWLLNDQLTRNNWRFENLEEHREMWAGVPLLVAYVDGGNTTGDGHNQRTKRDKDGKEYQSFTDATAERICGALNDDSNDIRIEERDGAKWVVGKGFLWAWYAHELVEQIVNDFRQGKVMSVSIEALVTDGYVDDNGVEVETKYTPLGVCLLGHGVAPAVPDAHIVMLSEMESEFKNLKLRAASYIEQASAPKPNETDKGVKKAMRLNKKQIKSLQAKFDGYTVLAAEQSENGVFVGLMSADGKTATYKMGSLDEVIVPERIEIVNAQVHFCAEEGAEVCADACDMVEAATEASKCAEDRAECAEKALAEANEKIAQMEAAESARRLSAAKKTATDTLAAFNANREDKVDEKVLSALTADIEAGKFTACEDENHAWTGDKSVEEKVLSLCATAVMEMDKANAAKAAKPMTWGGVKQASAQPGTIGELFAAKN